MGNFSRDPRLRAADSIAKHYVAVPLQQAVPVLDADWNEAENLRRHQHELLGARFIGSGVPAGEDGFRVGTVAVDNDFAIKRGTLLVEGKVVVNDADTTYVTQPNAALAPPLATPAADTPQIAYLDTWEREVDGQEDPALVDSRIGVETFDRDVHLSGSVGTPGQVRRAVRGARSVAGVDSVSHELRPRVGANTSYY